MIYNFDSTMPNALTLSGTAGALRNILKTYLVDGAGAGPVATLTVASGIATATYASGHPFRAGAIAQFAGATPSGLNGLKPILSVATNSITFAAPGVADGAATGSVTSKLAAAGWTELYTGTNITALKPSVVEATGCVLRIDDTTTTTARVVGYEAMTDVSTGTGAFPTAAQVSGGLYWPKSDAASAAARPWRLVADDRAALLWVAPNNTYPTHGLLVGFGDLLPDKSGDAYSAFLAGGLSAAGVLTTAAVVQDCLGYASAVPSALYVPRSYTGVGSATSMKKLSAYNRAAAYSGTPTYNSQSILYPNGADNSLRLSSLDVLDTYGFRGRVPGVYHSPQTLGEAFVSGDLVPGSGGFAGATMLALRVGAPGAALANAGCVFIDLTRDWRA